MGSPAPGADRGNARRQSVAQQPDFRVAATDIKALGRQKRGRGSAPRHPTTPVTGAIRRQHPNAGAEPEPPGRPRQRAARATETTGRVGSTRPGTSVGCAYSAEKRCYPAANRGRERPRFGFTAPDTRSTAGYDGGRARPAAATATERCGGAPQRQQPRGAGGAEAVCGHGD